MRKDWSRGSTSISRSQRMVKRRMMRGNAELTKLVFDVEGAAESEVRILFSLADIDEL